MADGDAGEPQEGTTLTCWSCGGNVPSTPGLEFWYETPIPLRSKLLVLS
jgi:hypothetical protein